jgi:putative nucleotidyltransferase with HDIG domain
MGFLKKIRQGRSPVHKDIFGERFSQIGELASTDVIISILLWLLFVVLCVLILSFEMVQQVRYFDFVLISVIVMLVCLAAATYIQRYQKRIIRNHGRALGLVGLFISLLAAAKIATLLSDYTYGATATAVASAIFLAITYEQRFAMGMSMLYCLLACLAVGPIANGIEPGEAYQLRSIGLLLTMAAGSIPCCLFLSEIRTRMKLLEVSALAAAAVFIMALVLGLLDYSELSRAAEKSQLRHIFINAGYHSAATFIVGLVIQGLLPLIEKIFGIATSMTLLDYSRADQELLKRLAMEAPGTFSHSLLIGSIVEAAADTIGRNGLLCRVGAYYHDIGKINKARYFIENEMGMSSQHKELSPAMSQLIIVSHVKDGIELAKEYRLPRVLWQFIDTHHGTTLVAHFYDRARKLKANGEPLESEFRYPGPKPQTKEAAIVMLADTVEGAVRSLPEITPMKIEAVVHNMAMKRLQDSQFDECDLTLRELSQIEASLSKSLAAHYHGRIAYPKSPDLPDKQQSSSV